MAALIHILVRQGALARERALQLAGSERDEMLRLRALLDSGELSEQAYARARAVQFGVPFVLLEDEQGDPELLSRLSVSFAHANEIAPLSVREGSGSAQLVLAMADPENVVALDDVRVAYGMPVTIVVATATDIHTYIDRHHRADEELSALSTSFESADEDKPDDSTFVVSGGGGDDDAPIVRFVNLVLGQGIRDRASDIHIEPTADRVRVRYRIDGVLHEMPSAPKSIQSGVISRLKIMSDIDIAERRIPQDGRISVQHEGRKVDLRVATLPTVWGEKIVMRILDQSGTAISLESLNLSRRNLETYRAAYTKPYGMILVTGPTGSGKSTTLYSTVSELAKPEVNVITIEDPVEYRMNGVNQVQINTQAGLTFANALRAILRSDPDVMLVGEIRDAETANIAIESALTGHLVLSTLHTNDAPSAVTRLIEMGVEPFLVGSALDVVVAQRLIRRLCDRCKEPDGVTDEELAVNGFARPMADNRTIYRPVGCQHCAETGYRGRAAIHEVMAVTEEIERLAVARASSTEIAHVARAQGMHTLREDGWLKALEGMTSIEEILRVVA
ncbi:GspE/PulE family protein [Microbacterium rhizophilus]|uniref:GspE/PulE family protein n=1 Tax=Microbacterium rhizophilus TaxID=3138934 RepID=UPI0035C8CA05